MSEYDKFLTLAAQQQWEITKGHLRATVSVVGAAYSGDVNELRKFNAEVEDFIKDIEENERHLP